MQPFRVFTLEQANHMLERVSEATRQAQSRIDRIRSRSKEVAADDIERQARAAVESWMEAVLGLGAQPKGVFTVDFRSPDPSVLWCWAPGEERIEHRHFAWESFKDRISVQGGSWPARN